MSSHSSLKKQWISLFVLSAIHFFIDLFAGMFPIIMPAVQERFGFSMNVGISIIAVSFLVGSFIQPVIGHIRCEKTRPILLPLGLLLMSFICFIAAIEPSEQSVWMIFAFAIISAIGVGITHPELMRIVHGYDLIKPSFGNSVFLNAGYLGFASGGFVAAMLITGIGFNGLYVLLPFAIISIAMVYVEGFKLAIEKNGNENNHANILSIGFPPIFFMALSAVTVPVLIGTFLPQQLNLLGFDLSYAGVVIMIFTFGTIVGAFFWSAIAHKKGELKACLWSLLPGVFSLLGYVFWIENKYAVALLFFTGFTSGSAYPLMVTLARYAKGGNLGRRMGFVIGGTWGGGSAILLLLGFVAKEIGIMPILYCTPIFYVISFAICLICLIKTRN